MTSSGKRQFAVAGEGKTGPSGPDHVAPDCRGINFFDADAALSGLLRLHMAPELYAHIEPHMRRLGGLAGGRLDELAGLADRHPPVLHHRDRLGRDAQWIEYHPAYREMERIAFGEFGMHAMSHRAGVLDWPEVLPPLAKYAFTYLFVQGEFGLMCPISVSDTSIHLIRTFGDAPLKARFLDRMTSQDMDELLKGTQFMTERAGGSDVGAIEATARWDGADWRLYGDKWFCSHADADVVTILARPEGAPEGTRGLGLFVMPRKLADGGPNAFRIVRLKDKLGTRSMATAEIVLEGAVAYPVGPLDQGFKQMMAQVNLSRLSHGVRAAAMMRRCLNESLVVARHRRAFGRTLIAMPLMRRQLLKIMVPTEQALTFFVHTAAVMGDADGGDEKAARELRILTPLIKFRACRDNIRVATAAMEVRGGNGYVEDWVEARLVRDAHAGVLWEGTSNIAALDVVGRAVAKEHADEALKETLLGRMEDAAGIPGQFRGRLESLVERAHAFARETAADAARETETRRAAGALYHAASAALLADEGARIGGQGGDARRLILARLVVDQRLSAHDPMAAGDGAWEEKAAALLLDPAPVPLDVAADLVVA